MNKYVFRALIVLISIGVVLIVLSLRSVYLSTSTSNIGNTIGVISHSSYAGQLIGGTNGYYAKIEYKYNINGKEFVNDRIDTDVTVVTFSNKNDVIDYLKKYTIMTEVIVYYDINEPKNSYLYTRIGFGAMFFMVFGLAMLYVAYKIKKQNKI